jgi:N-methylhydantoinase A
VILGVDVGGTFTDVVAWDGSSMRTAKVLTTPDQSRGVVAGVEGLIAGRAEALIHGTTVATNALLERAGARTALVTSEGFGDVIEIGRQDRPSLYDPFDDRSEPLVPRELRLEATAAGSIGPDPFEDAEAVAVSMLYAYVDPGPELAVYRQIRERYPDLPISLSSEVAPEFREFERTSTTVLNAYLSPATAGYLRRLIDQVDAAGLASTIAVMRSSGGLIPAEEAARLPVAVLLSGPAGGVVAAAAMGSLLGHDHVISFDMGGTSTDVCRIENGAPEISYERSIEGYPSRMASAAIHTVGAGGGSLGWIDAGGSMRVGPQSAGADPGPACYGRGGKVATVTDANVVLGRLSADATLGGVLPIDGSRARTALARLGDEIGIGAGDAALGMVRVVEEVMAGAIRSVSIEQGADPRGAALVAFGGAGGLHSSALARSLDMARVVIPPAGGVFSALGMLLSPPRVDAGRSVLLDPRSGDELDRAVVAVAASVSTAIGSAGAVTETVVDVRYRGQAHELTVPYAHGEGWSVLADRFHAEHERRNGFRREDDPIEAVTVRARATDEPTLSLDDLPPWVGSGDAKRPTRVVTTGTGAVEAEGWWRDGLGAGDEVTGPAVIEEREATTYLAPGERAVVHHTGALEVTW